MLAAGRFALDMSGGILLSMLPDTGGIL